MRKLILLVLALVFVLPVGAQDGALTLTLIGNYRTGAFDESAAEIVAYDAGSQQLFVVNGDTGGIDVLTIADPAAPAFVTSLDLSAFGAEATHVQVRDGVLAVSVVAEAVDGNGMVAFFDAATGNVLGSVEVGVLPDQLTFSPDGSKVLTANEGQPNDDYSIDPEGSVSIIDVSAGFDAATVVTVGFADFNVDGARAAELPADVRIYGPNATVAQDLEPEYVTVSPDGTTAYVTLQEANAVAVIDIASATVSAIVSLGFKDHSVEGQGIDSSDKDGMINITTRPVFGMYQPDAIVAVAAGETFYLLTANEGDTRDYDTYSEESRVADLTLDAMAFPNAAELQDETMLGRLTVTTAQGDTDGDGDFDALYVPGARSFSVWAADGTLVWDSGDAFEQITAELLPEHFNSTNDENDTFDNRSDNKGPEPEGIVVGIIGDRTYAFIGLERIGGVMVYDVTDPTAPVYVTYANSRDFTGNAEEDTAGDLGPEGLLFIPAEVSPTGVTLLVVANEVSGSTAIFTVE